MLRLLLLLLLMLTFLEVLALTQLLLLVLMLLLLLLLLLRFLLPVAFLLSLLLLLLLLPKILPLSCSLPVLTIVSLTLLFLLILLVFYTIELIMCKLALLDYFVLAKVVPYTVYDCGSGPVSLIITVGRKITSSAKWKIKGVKRRCTLRCARLQSLFMIMRCKSIGMVLPCAEISVCRSSRCQQLYRVTHGSYSSRLACRSSSSHSH